MPVRAAPRRRARARIRSPSSGTAAGRRPAPGEDRRAARWCRSRQQVQDDEQRGREARTAAPATSRAKSLDAAGRGADHDDVAVGLACLRGSLRGLSRLGAAKADLRRMSARVANGPDCPSAASDSAFAALTRILLGAPCVALLQVLAVLCRIQLVPALGAHGFLLEPDRRLVRGGLIRVPARCLGARRVGLPLARRQHPVPRQPRPAPGPPPAARARPPHARQTPRAVVDAPRRMPGRALRRGTVAGRRWPIGHRLEEEDLRHQVRIVVRAAHGGDDATVQ